MPGRSMTQIIKRLFLLRKEKGSKYDRRCCKMYKGTAEVSWDF